MKTVFEKILIATVLLALTFLVGWAVQDGLRRDTIVQCAKLSRQTKEYPMFWLTPSEKQMCDGIGVVIDARVGNPYEK